jgi:signal transduction histidine kinase
MYFRIYIAIMGSVAVSLLIAGAMWHLAAHRSVVPPVVLALSDVVAESLPAASAPAHAQSAALAPWAERTGLQMALYTSDRRPIGGGGGELLAPPPAGQRDSGWVGGVDSAYARKLPDGRWLLIRFRDEGVADAWRVAAVLLIIALVVGVSVHPVVRRITRRLEVLQTGVDRLGKGDLAARVDLVGDDEVGSLARSFNVSASRIESLVAAHKSLLANASHEFRGPLARIQIAMSLFGQAEELAAREEIHSSIRELDQLVGEILLASRLEAGKAVSQPSFEPVDFTALVAEECARVSADLDGSSIYVLGDAALLRRLVRNLLENARRYGSTSSIDVTLSLTATRMAELRVCDRGPGIPMSERERVFEPFYRVPGSRDRDGGVGLGLALVRSIAREHSGQICIEDRDGGGCCFRFSMEAQFEAGSGLQ